MGKHEKRWHKVFAAVQDLQVTCTGGICPLFRGGGWLEGMGGRKSLGGRLQIFCCWENLYLPLFTDTGDAPLLVSTALLSSPIRPQPLTPTHCQACLRSSFYLVIVTRFLCHTYPSIAVYTPYWQKGPDVSACLCWALAFGCLVDLLLKMATEMFVETSGNLHPL
jgi:hypothetical protein